MVNTLQRIKIGLYDTDVITVLHWVVRVGCSENFIFQLRSSSAGRDGIEVVEENLPGSRDPRPSAVQWFSKCGPETSRTLQVVHKVKTIIITIIRCY